MLLRNLTWKGIPIWPPEWWISDCGAGEEGILEDVQLYQEIKLECIHVVARHLGDIRNGIIMLENPDHLKALYYKLKENLGRPLTMIGDMELNLLPSLHGQKQVKNQLPIFAQNK